MKPALAIAGKNTKNAVVNKHEIIKATSDFKLDTTSLTKVI